MILTTIKTTTTVAASTTTTTTTTKLFLPTASQPTEKLGAETWYI
jgi:hypothetical protein